MIKGPLVKLAIVFAAILIVLSFLIVAFPDMIQTISILAGVVAVAAIIILLVMFIRMRKI